MNVFKQVAHSIHRARKLQMELDECVRYLYGLLETMEVDLQASTRAENADHLEDAISCYIQYGEYDLGSIMKEIKDSLK